MRVTRVLDLVLLAVLGVAFLMPRPDVAVKAALLLPAERRERVSELQAMMLGQEGGDGAVEPAIELANLYLDGHRPDWALATLGAVLPQHPQDHRLYHLRAIAYADRFESLPAFESASRALALCEAGAAACGEASRSRLHLLKSTLESVAAIDMRKDPVLAKQKIFEALRPVYVPKTVAKKKPPAGQGTPPTPAGKTGAKTGETTGGKPAPAAP